MFGKASGRPKTLVLIRHGESARNKAKEGATYFADEEARKMLKGVPDNKIPLTELGWQQACEAGLYLRDTYGVPDYMYDSGYLRTKQTAEGLREAYTDEERAKIVVRHNRILRERDPGYTYSMTTQEAEMHFPYLKEYWATFGGFAAYPPGGESLQKMAERILSFLNMIFRDRDNETVYVVSHGGTIRSFRSILEHWDDDRALQSASEPPDNCSLTVYQQEQRPTGGKRLVLAEANDTKWRQAAA